MSLSRVSVETGQDHYVALMVEPAGEEDRYLLAGVEPERLRQFRIGELDLRSLLLERAEDDWFVAMPRNGFDAPLALEPQASPLQDCPDLPEPGFLLHDAPADSEALKEARSHK